MRSNVAAPTVGATKDAPGPQCARNSPDIAVIPVVSDPCTRSGGTTPGAVPPQDVDDVDLADCLRRIGADRDERAFDALFSVIAPRVRIYMMRRGADASMAEDLAQEALAIVWTKAGAFDAEKGNPLAWVFAIARNLRIDRLRRERVWQVTEALPEHHAETSSDDASQEDIVAEREIGARVREVLASLPDDQREIIELSYLSGLSHSEIKAQTGLPLGTIKSRMRLAYEKLRPVLATLHRS